MICIMASQPHLGMATIFFYTCFWIPFFQMKMALARLFDLLLFITHQHQREDTCCNQTSLPVARFQDLQAHGSKKCGQVLGEACSICLVEFERDDLVSQLANCGHVFHMPCIERWIESSHFTCPICRSLLFNVNTSQAKWVDDDVDNPSSYITGFSWHY